MMKDRSTVRVPSNVRTFRSRILGLESSRAVLLVLMVSVAAFASRFSIDFSGLMILSALAFIVPVKRGNSLAHHAYNLLSWKLSSLTSGFTDEIRIEQWNGFQLVRDRRKTGMCIEIRSEDYRTFPLNVKWEFSAGVKSVFSSMKCNFTFVSIPFTIESDEYHVAGSDALSENYNLFMDYLIKGQFYYRSFVILWGRSTGDYGKLAGQLKENAEKVVSGLSPRFCNCTIISDKRDIEWMIHNLV